MRRLPGPATLFLAGTLALTACADDASDGPTTDATESTAGDENTANGVDADRSDGPESESQQRYPDVVDAELEADGDRWRLGT